VRPNRIVHHDADSDGERGRGVLCPRRPSRRAGDIETMYRTGGGRKDEESDAESVRDHDRAGCGRRSAGPTARHLVHPEPCSRSTIRHDADDQHDHDDGDAQVGVTRLRERAQRSGDRGRGAAPFFRPRAGQGLTDQRCVVGRGCRRWVAICVRGGPPARTSWGRRSSARARRTVCRLYALGSVVAPETRRGRLRTCVTCKRLTSSSVAHDAAASARRQQSTVPVTVGNRSRSAGQAGRAGNCRGSADGARAPSRRRFERCRTTRAARRAR